MSNRLSRISQVRQIENLYSLVGSLVFLMINSQEELGGFTERAWLFCHQFCVECLVNSLFNFFGIFGAFWPHKLFFQEVNEDLKLRAETTNFLGALKLLKLALHSRSQGRNLIAQHVAFLLDLAALAFLELIEVLRPLLDLGLRLVHVGLQVFRRAP